MTIDELDALFASVDRRNDVLCLYLNTDPTSSENHRPPPAYEIWAKRELANLETAQAEAGHEARLKLRGLISRVNEHLASLKPESKGLAIIAGGDFWQTYALPAALANRLDYGKPNLAPLLSILTEQLPYGLVQVDHRQARWVRATQGRPVVDGGMGMVLDTSQWSSHDLMPSSGETAGGGGTRAGTHREAYEHRVDEHTRTFYRQVAEKLAAWVHATGLPALIIGGNDEAVALLRELLPTEVARRVAGTISLPNYLPDTQLIERAAPLAEQHAQAAVAGLVEDIIGTSLAGGAAALGASDVLGALSVGQAKTVAMGRVPEAIAWQCSVCDAAFGQALERCTDCGGEVEASSLDGIATRLARRSGAEMRFVWGAAAEKLAEYGGVGALLRFA